MILPISPPAIEISYQSSGTPKNLEQAIGNGLRDFQISDGKKKVEEHVKHAIVDFLAQRFSVAMVTNPSCSDAMRVLYEAIRKTCEATLSR